MNGGIVVLDNGGKFIRRFICKGDEMNLKMFA
jgi:hypothetical protein